MWIEQIFVAILTRLKEYFSTRRLKIDRFFSLCVPVRAAGIPAFGFSYQPRLLNAIYRRNFIRFISCVMCYSIDDWTKEKEGDWNHFLLLLVVVVAMLLLCCYCHNFITWWASDIILASDRVLFVNSFCHHFCVRHTLPSVFSSKQLTIQHNYSHFDCKKFHIFLYFQFSRVAGSACHFWIERWRVSAYKRIKRRTKSRKYWLKIIYYTEEQRFIKHTVKYCRATNFLWLGYRSWNINFLVNFHLVTISGPIYYLFVV